MSPEDKAAIEQDIADAKSKLISKEMQQQIEEAKKQTKEELMKELETKQKLEEQDKQIATLKAEKEKQEKEAADRLDKIQARVDDIISSKASIKRDDPFKDEGSNIDVDRMSDETVDDIEEKSARAFFGEEYEHMLRQGL